LEKKIGIIIPVYNEGENIGKTLNAIKQNIKTPYTIYLVYDFDEDNTIPIAQKHMDGGFDLILLKNESKGVLGAIKTGFNNATEEALLVTMADLSDDYTVVDQMYDQIAIGFDVICGSRYMRGGKQVGGPLIKKTLSRFAGISLRYLANLPTHDVTNSFKLYRKSVLTNLKIESEGGFEIGMEIVIKSHFSGFKVTECPCVWRDRSEGTSRFKLWEWLPKYFKWYFYGIMKRIQSPM
jgi:glycosyltransferase involved in cell wall biosynthesis